jgi:hypothetical protein
MPKRHENERGRKTRAKLHAKGILLARGGTAKERETTTRSRRRERTPRIIT